MGLVVPDISRHFKVLGKYVVLDDVSNVVRYLFFGFGVRYRFVPRVFRFRVLFHPLLPDAVLFVHRSEFVASASQTIMADRINLHSCFYAFIVSAVLATLAIRFGDQARVWDSFVITTIDFLALDGPFEEPFARLA